MRKSILIFIDPVSKKPVAAVLNPPTDRELDRSGLRFDVDIESIQLVSTMEELQTAQPAWFRK